MLNGIIVFLVVAALLLAGYKGTMDALTTSVLESAKNAVEIAFGLIGVMALFLGLMKVVEDAGMLRSLSRLVSPVMRRLFPGVPAGHPAMSAMILNISANMLGLANAATPFGIRAIEELDSLNSKKGTATDAMALFLAINTAGLALLPSGVAGVRFAVGSEDAWGIWFPTLFASGTATIVAICVATLLARLPYYRRSAPPPLPPEQLAAVMAGVDADVSSPSVDPSTAAADDAASEQSAEETDVSRIERKPVPWKRGVAWLFWAVFVGLMVRHAAIQLETESAFEVVKGLMSEWSLVGLVGFLVLFGWVRNVGVYDSMVVGAKSGFEVFVRIVPFLVAILVAVGMFRASGGIDLIRDLLGPLTSAIGLPTEALPMAILRPLSGSGAFGVMAETMQANGPDSLIGYLVSTMQGSTETTFYVLAVYYGAVRVKNTRHTVVACLAADVAGLSAAVFICNLLFS